MPRRDSFHERLSRFISYLGLKPTSFEAEMGFSNGSISKLLNERRALGTDRLETIVAKYPELNVDWLITGKGEMLTVSGSPISIAREPESFYDGGLSTSIPIADIKAAAGSGYMNTEALRASEFIHLPKNLTKKGKHLCIRIKGNSMSPTLQDGGYVVIRLLDITEWQLLISDRVYVVTDKEGQTFLKRVRNRFDNGFIVLTSDNPDKATYPNFNLQSDEIVSIWYVEWYLSAKMPNIHDQFYSKLERMENNIDDLNRRFDELSRIITTLKLKEL
jgi:phage repressor protein C with HTH and peptisase S24 domain